MTTDPTGAFKAPVAFMVGPGRRFAAPPHGV